VSATPTRGRRDTPPFGTTVLRGSLVILVLLGLGYLATRLYNGIPGRDYKTVYVATPQVGNLLPHDPVRIAGARVGQVVSRDLDAAGHPLIKLQIEPGVRIPSDTSVAIRANGLLGARFVQLIPGTNRTEIPDGATIRGGPTAFTFGLPEALDTFDEQTRGRLGDVIDNLGAGMLGNGDGVNGLLHAGGQEAGPFADTAREILDRRPGALRRLVPSLTSATTPLNENRTGLSALMGVAADALDPLVSERQATRATLAAAPPALAAARAGLLDGRRLIRSIDAVAAQANRTLPYAPRGLSGLAALLGDARQPLRRAEPLLEDLRPLVPSVLRITRALSPVLSPARGLLGDLEPMLIETGRYKCDLTDFAVVMRSMTGYGIPARRGPNGPAGDFRLQLTEWPSVSTVGLKDATGLYRREGYQPPCKYLSKPYPQYLPAMYGRRHGR